LTESGGKLNKFEVYWSIEGQIALIWNQRSKGKKTLKSGAWIEAWIEVL